MAVCLYTYYPPYFLCRGIQVFCKIFHNFNSIAKKLTHDAITLYKDTFKKPFLHKTWTSFLKFQIRWANHKSYLEPCWSWENSTTWLLRSFSCKFGILLFLKSSSKRLLPVPSFERALANKMKPLQNHFFPSNQRFYYFFYARSLRMHKMHKWAQC